MRGLIRHHGTVRALPKAIGVGIGMATVGMNLLFFSKLQDGGRTGLTGADLFEISLLLGVYYLLFSKEAGLRGSQWSRALPVDAAVLWTAHMRSLVLSFSVVVVSMAAVILGFAQLIRRAEPLEVVQTANILLHFVRPWLVLLALALSLGARRSHLADPANESGWSRWRAGLAVAGVLLLIVLSRLPLPFALLPVLGAFAWAQRNRRRLAPVLSLALQTDGTGVTTSGGDGDGHGRQGLPVVHWTVVRQLFKWPLTWILGLPMTLLLGLVLGGAFSYTPDADFARYFNLWITIYMMIAFVGHFLENLYRVDHLPLSRTMLLRWLVLPNVVCVVLGGLVGTGFDVRRHQGDVLAFENDASRPQHGLLVPVDQWRPTWGPPPETVAAPWGETRPADSVRVLDFLPLYLWNPFTTTPDASSEFVAWQIARAIEAVHGVALGPEEIRHRYLTVAEDGAVAIRESGLTPVADGLVPERGVVGPILGILLALVVPGSLLTFWVIFRLCGPGITRRRMKATYWSAMGVLMVFHLGGYGLLMGRMIDEWTVTALFEGMAFRLSAMGTFGWAMPWIAGAVASFLGWRLCTSAFQRVEAVRGGPTCLF